MSEENIENITRRKFNGHSFMKNIILFLKMSYIYIYFLETKSTIKKFKHRFDIK